MRSYDISICLFLCGCSLSPIPKNIQQVHSQCHQIRDTIEFLLEPGDLIFRQGEAQVAGSINFSKFVAQLSDSDFSHVVLVQRVDTEALIIDVSIQGLQRYYLIDWLMEGRKNIVVKRLKSEYRKYIPTILNVAEKIIIEDPLYDEYFQENNDTFYCIEAVDYCFRKAGLPLADKIPINQLPNYSDFCILLPVVALIRNLDLSTPVAVAGNDKIGLFSSPHLETVVDLR